MNKVFSIILFVELNNLLCNLSRVSSAILCNCHTSPEGGKNDCIPYNLGNSVRPLPPPIPNGAMPDTIRLLRWYRSDILPQWGG